MLPPWILYVFLLLASSASSLDFIYNSFFANSTSANLTLTDDARVQPPVIRFTSDTKLLSLGRVFYPSTIPFKSSNSSNVTTSSSTQFVFSIQPDITSNPGFGIAFVLCNSPAPPNAMAGQYFGLFTSGVTQSVYPLLAVEFDTGRNPELNDPDRNHVGIDLDSVVSVTTQTAGYYNATGDPNNFIFVPVPMRNGHNIHVWIDFNGPRNEINVTIAPAGVPRPAKTLLSYRNPAIANFLGPEMFVGFSASMTQWIEAQRLLAWSFSDVGVARDINTTGFPVFLPVNSGSYTLFHGTVAGIVVGCVVAAAIAAVLVY